MIISSRDSHYLFQHQRKESHSPCFRMQRVLPVRLRTVEKKRSPGVQMLVEEYIAKLRLYFPAEDVQLRSNHRHAQELRDYCFVLVELMAMGNCEHVLMYQSSCFQWF
ncbi:Methyltransferases isoform 1 [Tripterygium wilfordii]|uniref:Methyltransferases isoform 1 n=1 Tax=Tripterygium wilfordii TaxID=458696 RepID=A0A7J7DNW0_TRIWF|nr:Methyltransferases isoform 1 [Tripterygium wilfordii]